MSAEDWQIVWFTAWVSALSTVVILPFGLAAGLLLARRDWPGKSVVETIISLPLVMPPVATGLLLLKLLGRRGPLGAYRRQHLWRRHAHSARHAADRKQQRFGRGRI